MAHYIERQETPILIADRIEWVEPAAALERRASFMRTFDAWRAARRGNDSSAQARFYAADSRGLVLNASEAPRGERKRAASLPAAAGAEIDAVSVLAWKDDRDVVVVTFTESAPSSGRPRLKRQYWLENAGTWQVIYEGSLG